MNFPVILAQAEHARRAECNSAFALPTRLTNPTTCLSPAAATVSPSPGGEGRGEGERLNQYSLLLEGHTERAECNSAFALPTRLTNPTTCLSPAAATVSPSPGGEGRGEGERLNQYSLLLEGHTERAECNPAFALPDRVTDPHACLSPAAATVSPSPRGGLEPFGETVQGIRRSRRPVGPNERARVSPRRGEGERLNQYSLLLEGHTERAECNSAFALPTRLTNPTACLSPAPETNSPSLGEAGHCKNPKGIPAQSPGLRARRATLGNRPKTSFNRNAVAAPIRIAFALPVHVTNPNARLSLTAATVSPSPGGEGRGEGERLNQHSLLLARHTGRAEGNSAFALPTRLTNPTACLSPAPETNSPSLGEAGHCKNPKGIPAQSPGLRARRATLGNRPKTSFNRNAVAAPIRIAFALPVHVTNPNARLSLTAATVSPSPGGGLEPFGKTVQGIRRSRRPVGPNERARVSPRRGEGERLNQYSLLLEGHTERAECNSAFALPTRLTNPTACLSPAAATVSPSPGGEGRGEGERLNKIFPASDRFF